MASTGWGQLIHEAKESGGGGVDSGVYDVYVETAQAKRTSKGDKQMIKMKMKITSGPLAGQVIYDQLVLTTDNPNALSFFFGNLAALGVSAERIDSFPPPDQGGMEAIAAAVVNARATVTVEKGRMYNGVPQTDVKSYAPSAQPASGFPVPAPGPAPVSAPPAPPVPAPAAPPGYAPPPVAQPAWEPPPVYDPSAVPAPPPAAQYPAPGVAEVPMAPPQPPAPPAPQPSPPQAPEAPVPGAPQPAPF